MMPCHPPVLVASALTAVVCLACALPANAGGWDCRHSLRHGPDGAGGPRQTPSGELPAEADNGQQQTTGRSRLGETAAGVLLPP